MSMKINQSDKESQIRELLDLTMRVANETNKFVTYEFNASGSESCLYLYVLTHAGEVKENFLMNLMSDCEFEMERGFSQAKEALEEILKEGKVLDS